MPSVGVAGRRLWGVAFLPLSGTGAMWAGLGLLACHIKAHGHAWHCKSSKTSRHDNPMFHTSLMQGLKDVLERLCLLLRAMGEREGGREISTRGGPLHCA